MRRIAALVLVLLACKNSPPSESDADAGSDADGATADRWQAVTDEIERSLPSAPAGVTGMTLVIFDAADNRVYEHTSGDFASDRRVGIASASKMVTGLTLLRLIDAGELAFTDTTGDVLGWTGPKAEITLDQLGGFVSGMRNQFLCVFNQNITLADCVDTMEAAAPDAAPGVQFEYGNTHLHVAARMAEVASGRSWRQIVDEELFTPLGIAGPELVYAGNDNPGVSGTLQATIDEYAEILALLFHRGQRAGQTLISGATIARMSENHYTAATVVSSPYDDYGFDYRYSFASWLECENAPATCESISSPGAFGFTPWVDHNENYYAILGMKANGGAGSVFSVQLQHRLRPLIDAALAE